MLRAPVEAERGRSSMLDLKFIRDNPETVRKTLLNKGVEADLEGLLQIDKRRRELLTQVEELKRLRNETSTEINKRKKAGEDTHEMIHRMREVGQQVKALDAQVVEAEDRVQELLYDLPNIYHQSVPLGKDESENPEVKQVGKPPELDFPPKPHWDVGEQLGILDIAAGAKISGSRFYVLRGAGARLERALIGFMIDLHVREHGYEEIWPPVLVRQECMVGTGQLPKFGEDAYHCEIDDLWLVPTAEVPVTNLHRDEILTGDSLPLKYVAYTPCFRREAGAAGRDTRGIIRVHQFDKVELVKFCTPETSYDELDALLANAETVLQRLGLHYRVVEMCTGDLGFTAAKKFDPEVWMPGSNRYVEISSCSNFESFQARRANIRFRAAKGERVQFAHTLNGSGVAVGRALAAVLENYQQEDGSLLIPAALRPYMGGTEVIEPNP